MSTRLLLRRFCSRPVAKTLYTENHLNGQVKRIVLNDPTRRNPLGLNALQGLKAELLRTSHSADLRVLILAASPPMFSAGHDLKQLRKTDERSGERQRLMFKTCTEVMTLIQDIQLPVIAEVKGLAAAAGCQMAASCDIVIAANNASFSTPGIKFGLFCSTPGVALSRAVPRKVALDMLLTGDTINAGEALRAGLVSRIVAEKDVETQALAVAEKICGYSKPVVALGKSFFYTQVQSDRNTAYRHGEAVMIQNLALKDCQEGLTAFVEKRQPKWTHRPDEA